MKIKKLFPFFLLFVFLLFLFTKTQNLSAYDDEPTHIEQISLFINNRFQLIQGIAVIPFFHFLISQIAKLFNFKSISQLRLINLFISFFNISIFYLLAKKINTKTPFIKTLQFAFLPILFPYRFLLYTENLSILLVLISFYLAVEKKNFLSFILASFAVLTKQINIIWYLFIFTFLFLQDKKGKTNNISFTRFIRKYYYFNAGVVAFVIFVILNRGVAITTQNMHPLFIINPGNIYWFLFIFFILFLPLILSQTQQIINLLRKNKNILISQIFFIIIAASTFSLTHPWNQYPEHLRNRLLLFFLSSPETKLIFFTIISLSVLSIFLVQLKNQLFYLFYFFAFLSFIPIWLVESRYVLVPFIFFILYKRGTSRKIELATLAIFIILSLYFFNGYIQEQFYL